MSYKVLLIDDRHDDTSLEAVKKKWLKWPI